jgi:hypothetical protein
VHVHHDNSRFSGFGHDVGRMALARPAIGAVQMKPAIDGPGDAHERQAKRLSERVTATPDARTASIRAIASSGDRAASADVPVVDRALSSPGRPLEPATRVDMESRFGHDFSRVRVHTGSVAAASADAIGARAYTTGCDVVFGASQYSPGTRAGRRLLAHELTHVVQQQSLRPGAALQRAPKDEKPTEPTLIDSRRGNTDRIEDAYATGTLGETAWRNLLASAEANAKTGIGDAQAEYLRLYADIAKLAQTSRVLDTSLGISVVTGGKESCQDAKAGLNLSMRTSDGWGANATTALIDLKTGKLGANLSPPGEVQPPIAIVLSRDAFKANKEETLGILRHEMIHAEHDDEDTGAALAASRKDKKGPVRTSVANSELLGYLEGFMTMFHLAEPAPDDSKHPAFIQLRGMLTTKEANPWAEADPSFRSEALGRLREYYCHALDQPHRESFDGWVRMQSAAARVDRLAIRETVPSDFSPGSIDLEDADALQGKVNPLGATIRAGLKQDDFYRGLERIISGRCVGLSKATQMKL